MGQEDKHLSGDPQGIEFFEGTWDEALAKADKENKLIFLDVYASWCGPCKVLKAKTFPDPAAGKFFNEHFINVSLDGEKGDGIKVARQLRVRAYPSLFMLNPNGEPVVYYAGYLKPEELIQFGQAGLDHKN
ncbi:MAG: hypothetical protein Kow00127_01820 [Bacteroidales bacterium]